MEDEYVEVYLTKEGKGAGYARNIGMTHAKGKWLLFADADDFFTENAFEHFFASKDSPHEIIYFKSTSCFSDTLEPANRADRFNVLVDNMVAQKHGADEAIRYKWHGPCAKMVNRRFISENDIWFDEVMLSEDVMFSAYSGYLATSVNAVNQEVYCMTIRRGSLTTRLTPDFLMTKHIVALQYNEFLRNHNLSRWQTTIVVYYLLYSIRYGINVFYKCVKLAFQYKMNPFAGIVRGISKYISFRKDVKQRASYVSRD
jgi:glycosyltransferase involved in cell wall biosynthesis